MKSVSSKTIPSGFTGTLSRLEWPTWLLTLAVYASWLLVIVNFSNLPALPAHIALVVVTAWHMSLQHELLHGHPTRSKAFNRLLGLMPLCVWYPYDIYRDGHLAHHRDELLTVPGIDTECNYVWPRDYDQLPRPRRALLWALRTALGRFAIGPAMVIPAVWAGIVREPLRGDFRYTGTWAMHIALLAGMLWWVQMQSGMSTTHYLLAIAYPAMGLAMLRSFYEHRPAELPAHRIVINEASLFWRLLYLNNNYHSVHHDHPGMPWYAIPAAYRADRTGYLQRNGGFLIQGYGYMLRHYAFHPVDSPVHPGLGTVASATHECGT
jgi:fatty acid desaturase